MEKLLSSSIILILIMTGILSGCTNTETDNSNYKAPVVPDIKFYEVVYNVTGTAESVSVTFENYGGGTSQWDTAYLPWDYPIYGMQNGDFVYISAQNNGEYGSVTSRIYVDGELFKTTTSYGAYVIATASGRLP